MSLNLKEKFSYLMDHYMAFCPILALVVLIRVGVGDGLAVSALGLLLCVAGMSQSSALMDPRLLAYMALYQLGCMASALVSTGSISTGFGAVQLIFPILYLLTSTLSREDLLLLRRLCVLTAAVTAAAGLVQFVYSALAYGGAGRLGGFLGNPNAMGMFLVLAWFAVLDQTQPRSRAWSVLGRLEPLILAALALTLSLGSFAAMAGGVLAFLWEKGRLSTFRAALGELCRVLARAVLGMGTGLLLCLTAAHTNAPWTALLPAAYLCALAWFWPRVTEFFADLPRMSLLVTALGLAAAGVAALLRPSAAATFPERLEMMASGARYLASNPLFGVGPYQWRGLDMQDGGKYFNTWHIHNAPLHMAVETGWLTAAALILMAVRFFRRGHSPAERGAGAAFCLHNLMDTSFFYLGVTGFLLLTVSRPGQRGRRLGGLALKGAFALCGGLCALHLLYWLGL